jgi:hypothetical protein
MPQTFAEKIPASKAGLNRNSERIPRPAEAGLRGSSKMSLPDKSLRSGRKRNFTGSDDPISGKNGFLEVFSSNLNAIESLEDVKDMATILSLK